MTTEKLFEAFPPVSAEQWVQQVVKDLKGQNFEEKLTYTSREGIVVKPFYTHEDLSADKPPMPLFSHTDWEICVELEGANEQDANRKALHALNNGATSLLFFVHHNANPDILLQGIRTELIRITFVVEGDSALFDKSLTAYLSAQHAGSSGININIDPIENLVRTGNWRNHEKADREELTSLLKSGRDAFNVTTNIYHNAGAAPAYEIACALAHANVYMNWCIDSGVNLRNRINIHTATGPDYFFEIAKLRAYRKVFALFCETYGTDPHIFIHTETATRNLTVFDAHNNLLRTTTAAMAATIGGCESLVVKPFDCTFEPENEFSERLARNIQLILKSESYFDKTADVSAGSYFVEQLTGQLAEKAWTYFKEIESQGGFLEALRKGIIQDTIRNFADTQQEKFDKGEEVLVGTNKYPDPKETKNDKAGHIFFGNQPSGTTTIEPLRYTRLSASAEKERLNN